MNGSWILQLSVFLVILIISAILLGEYMAQVFDGKKNVLSFAMVPVENFLYKIFAVDPTEEMDWKNYAFNLIIFNLIGLIFLFFLQEIQYFLPLNPQKFHALRFDTALNAAISYVTNTNWQSFKPESSISYFTEMLGMTVQNFLSAATGMSACIAFLRGFIRKTTYQLGNFWVILTRTILYVLLPLSIIFSLIFVSQGEVQNLHPYVKAQTIEGKQQVIAQGPTASQIAIKHIGTNGGGFFNTGSGHPYENPTPLTDYLEILGMLLIAAALPFTFGAMMNNRKQGIAIFSSMFILFLLGLGVALWAELHGSPILQKLGISGGVNFEGKEVRMGNFDSIFFANATTATSTGSVSASYDSFMPLTGLVLIFNMAIGEVIFGGVGTGIIGMLLYAILAMFLIGLMVGRSPEIFGKKLDPFEMIMTILALVLPAILQLILSAIAITSSKGLVALGNPGSHGLSEVLYAFASAIGNNGSSFSGLNANLPFYNLTTGIGMLAGRFITIIPSLAIAGSLGLKKINPAKVRFPTESPTFVVILSGVVVLIGALTFMPVYVLGPILEHLTLMHM